MINKLYEKVKQFMKENGKQLLLLLCLYLGLTFPLPYYIYSGGGTININDRISIEGRNKDSGSLHFAYVKELKGTVSTFLLAKLMSNWDIEKEEEMKLNENETKADIAFRNHIYLENANQTATLLAYQKAGLDISIKERHFYVLYVEDNSTTGLKIGDEIKQVNAQPLTTVEEYSTVVSETAVGEDIILTILRDGKEKEVRATVRDFNGKKLTGVTISTIYDYKTDPALKLKFKSTESGPSGGLMLTLAIYNKLIKEDITGGKTIVGTGTIESDGTVGSIGGVKYKLKGAVDTKADIFLVPAGENYEEAIKEKKEHAYDIAIYPVKTFEEALEILKEAT